MRSVLLPLFLALPLLAPAQNLDYHLQWRMIGSFRAGRVTCVAGVPGQPSTYYFGTPGGGVWKTDDGGQVWTPIFDSVRVASIGAIAIAPSDPNIIYVGTGEQTRGDGVYRSNDGGLTWKNIGLRDVPYIQSIVIDPQNPNDVVVGGNALGFAVIWRPLPNSAASLLGGIFRTTDGGATWTTPLPKNDTMGVFDLTADRPHPQTLFASLYRAGSEPTSDIVRSLDSGATWTPLASTGLPEKSRGRVGIASFGRRMYAILSQGFYRSDDGGATWTQSTKDPRVIGSNYFSRVFMDTRNPDVVYVAQTSLYRSTDGGHTFEAFVGAPSGDDFHVLWIDPRDPARMILGIDQGAVVSMNAGKTWSSWFNQPTGQYYHVSTDNQFPYRVYAAQQDSGTQSVPSRGDYGQIMNQDAVSVGGFEYSFIVPDPLHPDDVYSGGWYGTVVRFHKSTGQVDTVFERGEKYRTAQMAPLLFSKDGRTLYMGTQYVMKTLDRGQSWQAISPDLTGVGDVKPADKPDPDKPKPPGITAIALSMIDPRLLWAGTGNHIVQITRNAGSSWKNVSPPGLAEPLQVITLEASHHDPASAYVTFGARIESPEPAVLRTRDFGATWTKIATGLPPNEWVRVLRDDPKRKGLLFAGTDSGVFVSWDDGDHWRSFALNMPATPITDFEVHGNDLVVSTYGRSLWILDDITPLREPFPTSTAHLYQPSEAIRVRWDNNQDTPYPRETPAGKNPPDGAIFYYFLNHPGDVTMTIFDAQGSQIRQFAAASPAPNLPPPNVPEYWFAPPLTLPNTAGVNRFVWDLRYAAPRSLPYGYDGKLLEYTEYTFADHAIPGNTPRLQPQGPLVLPGRYIVELRAAGQTIRRTFTVSLDPRVHASSADLAEQLHLARQVTTGMKVSCEVYEQLAHAAAKKLDPIQKELGTTNRDLTRLLSSVESGDVRPSDTVREAVRQSCAALDKNLAALRQSTEAATFQIPASPGCGH